MVGNRVGESVFMFTFRVMFDLPYKLGERERTKGKHLSTPRVYKECRIFNNVPIQNQAHLPHQHIHS